LIPARAPEAPHHTRMHLTQRFALLGAMLTITGCRSRYVVPEQPMPPHTILLSAMMRELSAQPGFNEQLIHQLDGANPGKKGPALLTPDLLEELRKRVLGRNWQGLDRFPGWTMREINPTVRVADAVVGKDQKLESLSAVHPGAPAPALNDKQARIFLDLGPYALDKAETVSLDTPSTLPGFTTEGIVTPLGMGVVRGDGPNALATEHAQSQRLADVLNRLSVNALAEAHPFSATIGSHTARTPEDLIAALTATGHTVIVHDARYFANFGHLHYKGMDVMMPFWINTEIAVPGSGGLFHRPRPLLVPVSHAEYEWQIRGPRVNADVSHYFGVDGKAEWRTMDTLDQAWVLKRYAHTYTGAQALAVTRLIGMITLAYMHQHAARPTLPFGGYYTLGVCQDPVSAVEKKLTGRSTLFPNTADGALFDDPRDAEVNALFQAIPKDRAGGMPPPERIFGSLPANPGSGNSFSAITIPGLASDLAVTYSAWHRGQLTRTHARLFYVLCTSGVLALAAVAFGCAAYVRKRRRP
jgi:hypothetical protein